jgi:hypothetical protein
VDITRLKTAAKLLAGFLVILSLTLGGGQSTFTLDHSRDHALGDIPLDPATYQRYLRAWPEGMAEALPEYYNAMEEGIVTPAKNQGGCGSCWAFAAVGAMESHILKLPAGSAEDLSEQQQVSCNTAMAGCSGGNSSSIRYWEAKGPLYETCFPYTANDSTPCAEAGCTQLPYRVIDWATESPTTDAFKNSLYVYGPSYWRYNVYTDFDTYWSTGSPEDVYVSEAGAGYRGGHAVLLIGWDDSRGAFLCKNSWGGGGPNGDGTFWIAYEGHYNNLGFGMANFSLTSLTCSSDADCDDGVYCNGAETCVDAACQDGTPPDCSDDGLFCNGSEVCDELAQGCGNTGDPCGPGTVCNEDTDTCDLPNCDNGVCDAGEDCNNCPEDCISGSGGGSCDACFKGVCDGSCHPVKEGPDCADCATSWCCGDGTCEGEEDGFNCAIDCGAPPVCGDGTCDPGEDRCDCPEDCGQPLPTEEGFCSDGVDNDCDGLTDCDDSDCGLDPVCNCLPRGDVCTDDGECCSNRCHRGTCK